MTSKPISAFDARIIRFPKDQFFALFLPMALVIVVSGFFFVSVRTSAQLEAIVSNQRTLLYQLRGFMAAEIATSLNHLRSLASEEMVRQAIGSAEESSLQAMTSIFLVLARQNPKYHQIRWIDETGMERIRIQRENNKVFVMPLSELQDKGERYYFTDANALSSSELYVSRIDLNKEHGEIELPLKPTLRIAIPAEDNQGLRHGILVINIAVKYMLNILHDIQFTGSDMNYMLLNMDGIIINDKRDYSDSKLFQDSNFASRYPEIWNSISANESGTEELSSGLWVWETLTLSDSLIHLAQTMNTDNPDNIKSYSDQLLMKLVAYKKQSSLFDMYRDIRTPVVFGMILILGVYAWSVWFYLRNQLVKKHAELNMERAIEHAKNMEQLKELESRFRLLFESSSIGLLVVDEDGVISTGNPAVENMFGYTHGKLAGQLVDSLLPVELREKHTGFMKQYMLDPKPRKMGVGRELHAITKDGRSIPVEVGLNPIMEHGKPMVLVSVIDLSERSPMR